MECIKFYDYIEFLSSLDPCNEDLLAAIECLKRQETYAAKRECLKKSGLYKWSEIQAAIDHFQFCNHCREHFHKAKKLDHGLGMIFEDVSLTVDAACRFQDKMLDMFHSSASIPRGEPLEKVIHYILDHGLEDFHHISIDSFFADAGGIIQEIFGGHVLSEDILPDLPQEINLIGVRRSSLFGNNAMGALFACINSKYLLMHAFNKKHAGGLFHWDGKIQIKEHGSLQHAVWMNAPLVFALCTNLSLPHAGQVFSRFHSYHSIK